MQHTVKIDWLGYTVYAGEDYAPESLPGFQEGRPERSHGNYERVFSTKNTARVFENKGAGNEQGTFVELRGEACSNLDYSQMSQLCRWVNENHKSIARIDLAIDVLFDGAHEWINPFAWRAMYHAGKCETQAKTERMIDSTRSKSYTGATWMLGSGNSDRLLRVYDKAAELKISGKFWTRFELQCRNRMAEGAVDRIEENGIEHVVKRGIRSFANFDNEAFQAFTTPGTAQEHFYNFATRKETDVENYLDAVYYRLKREVIKSREHERIVMDSLLEMMYRLRTLSQDGEWDDYIIFGADRRNT